MSRKVTTAVFSTNSAPLKVAPHSAPKLSAEEKAAQAAFVEKTMKDDAMAALIAEKKRIDDQLKAAREAEKAARAERAEARKAAREARAAAKANRLEDEAAKQQQPARWHYHITGMVTRRMAAGQSQDEAIEGALAALRAVMVAKLAEEPTTDEPTTKE